MGKQKRPPAYVDPRASQQVELPDDAPTTLRSGGLHLRSRKGVLRVASGTTRDPREIIVLTPLMPDGWLAEVPRSNATWTVADARRWNAQLHAVLALAAIQPVSVRAHVMAEPLKTLARRIKLDLQSEPPPKPAKSKKSRKSGKAKPPKPGPYERSLSRWGPLHAGAPGLKQQR